MTLVNDLLQPDKTKFLLPDNVLFSLPDNTSQFFKIFALSW